MIVKIDGSFAALVSSVPCSHHYQCPLQVCTLVTMDIGGTGGSRVRSYYSATSVTDVALYTEPEEIHLVKNNWQPSCETPPDDGKEQICVLQVCISFHFENISKAL